MRSGGGWVGVECKGTLLWGEWATSAPMTI